MGEFDNVGPQTLLPKGLFITLEADEGLKLGGVFADATPVCEILHLVACDDVLLFGVDGVQDDPRAARGLLQLKPLARSVGRFPQALCIGLQAQVRPVEIVANGVHQRDKQQGEQEESEGTSSARAWQQPGFKSLHQRLPSAFPQSVEQPAPLYSYLEVPFARQLREHPAGLLHRQRGL